MMYRLIALTGLLIAAATPALAENPLHLEASVSASTSTVINGIVFNRPQYGAHVEGSHDQIHFGASIESAYSGNSGADHQDKYFVTYEQNLKPIHLRYEVLVKSYPGTRDGLTDHGVTYGVTASRSLAGFNVGLGVDYSDTDYTTIRKSYGMNLSLGHSLGLKMSSWLSISHHHQFGSVDYTNTNMGVYYSLSSKMGVSASINNWHAYAAWNHDRPTLSLSLSRKL